MFATSLRSLTFCLSSLCICWFSSAHAQIEDFKEQCVGCHKVKPVTCNGCHAHAVHGVNGDRTTINLVAKTDQTEYVAGDDIIITLSGGSQPRPDEGWVGIKIYDGEGVELGHIKTEMPATFTTRAYAGMTTLYVGWIGHEYDNKDAKFGAPMGDTFGAGMRLSFLAGLHLQERHIEEVIATNAFTVGTTPTVQADGNEVVDVGSAAAAKDGGGGSFDLLWIVSLLMVAAICRQQSQLDCASLTKSDGTKKISHTAEANLI